MADAERRPAPPGDRSPRPAHRRLRVSSILTGCTFCVAAVFPLTGIVAGESAGLPAAAPAAHDAGGPRKPGGMDAAADRALAQGRPADAVALLRTAVAAGDPRAMTRLALMYHLGQGVPEDDDEAYRLLGLAARHDDAAAMFWLGRMHLLGWGPARGSPDADRSAAQWFFEAARRDHSEAQYYLGLLFMAGTGVQRDDDEALKWIRRAAAGGHEPARRFGDASAAGSVSRSGASP